MIDITTYELGYCDYKETTRRICFSKYKDNYVSSYNKKIKKKGRSKNV